MFISRCKDVVSQAFHRHFPALSRIFHQVGVFSAHQTMAFLVSLRMSAPRLGLGSASEVESSYTLEGGYSTEALPDGTGAWLAHREKADVPGSGPGVALMFQEQLWYRILYR